MRVCANEREGEGMSGYRCKCRIMYAYMWEEGREGEADRQTEKNN